MLSASGESRGLRRSVPLRPFAEANKELTDDNPVLSPSSKMQRSPKLSSFRQTDVTNNIFTHDRSALNLARHTNNNVMTQSGPAPLEFSSINVLNKSVWKSNSSSSLSSERIPSIDDLLQDIVSKKHSQGFLDNFIASKAHMIEPITLLNQLTELYTSVARPKGNKKKVKVSASPGIVQFRVTNLIKKMIGALDHDEEWLRQLGVFVVSLKAGDEVDQNRASFFERRLEEIQRRTTCITNVRESKEERGSISPGKADVANKEKILSESLNASGDRATATPKKRRTIVLVVDKDHNKIQRKIKKIQDKLASLNDSQTKPKESKILRLSNKLEEYQKKQEQ